MHFLALSALALAASAANHDYVALKALYELTGGSGWTYNQNWDMSNTTVCGWNDPDYPHGTQQTWCTGGRVAGLCASMCCPKRRALPRRSRLRRPPARRQLQENNLSGTIPTEIGLLTELSGWLCARHSLQRLPPATHGTHHCAALALAGG